MANVKKTEAQEFVAELRSGIGTGQARASRNAGKIPAVIYGAKKENQHVALDGRSFERAYQQEGFYTKVLTLKVGNDNVRVLPRSVQMDPVKDTLVHVDFQRVIAGEKIKVKVPVHFLNEMKSPGLKRGGVLNIVRREIELHCTAEIPTFLEVDLDGLNIGDSVHISHIKLPAGVEPTIRDRDFTVATIVGRQKEDEVAAVVAAVAGTEGAAEAAAPSAAAVPSAQKAENKPKEEKK